MDSIPANVIRRIWPTWQQPETFAVNTFNQLIHALRADNNFWLHAIIEHRLKALASIDSTLSDMNSDLGTISATLDIIATASQSIDVLVDSIDATTSDLLAGLNGYSPNQDSNKLYDLMVEIKALLTTIEENTRPA